ncbi:MAG TPA: hypothetical protein VNO30_37320 [Kofleriaceae bacterium]|nr:hypothetical protein [Kofleriaceae bacterium]
MIEPAQSSSWVQLALRRENSSTVGLMRPLLRPRLERIRRATNSRTEAPSTGKALEQVFRRAFTADGGGQVTDEQSARVTFRLAATLRHLCDDLLDGRDPSERVLCSLAGLEVLMREHEPNSSRNNAVALLCDRLAPRFPAIVTELESYWTARSEAEITASQVELERWQTELYRLCSDIGESLAVRHSRGLILLSRIQMDNNQKVFRPLVDSLLSTDRLSEEQARTIQRLDATVLLDRHPLQVAAATRKIDGAARNDTIRDYESLIVKMNQALTLRMKLHGQTQKRAEAVELRAQLDRYAQHMQATSDEPGEWLLTRLLRREAVPVATLPWAPDSSVVAHPAATSVRVALLYAVAEPHILERTPERVVALGDPVGAFSPLLLAAARREGVAPLRIEVAGPHHQGSPPAE